MTPDSRDASGRSALVAGGTGLVGGHLLRLLGADARYHRVTSLVRRTGATPAGVNSQVVDFERLDQAVVAPVDDAFCCLGTTRKAAGSAAAFRHVDFDYIVAFAQLAKRAGATRFLLVSSVGASAQSRFLYTRTKGESESAISSIGFKSVVILRPSFLLGERGPGRPIEAMTTPVFRLFEPVLVGPFRKYAPVDSKAVARMLVSSAVAVPEGVTVVESDGITSPTGGG